MYSAVVAVHLFGQLADMPALLAASGGAPVIEDAAHAPLSYLNGRMAGRFGVAAFYSFASTKYWPAGGGGLAIVHQANLARKLADSARVLSQPSRIEELRGLVLQAAKAVVFNRSLYGFFGKPLRRWTDRLGLLEPCLDLKAIQRSVGRGGVPAGTAILGESRDCSVPTACASWHAWAGCLTSCCPRSGRERNTTIICFRYCCATARSVPR